MLLNFNAGNTVHLTANLNTNKMETDSEDPSDVSHDSLGEMSALDFNDRLVSLPIFTCKKCSNFLSPPIMLECGVGNVCGSCSPTKDGITAIHNSALELILQNLAIPCRNSIRGCKEKVRYFNMSTHEFVCDCRNYVCPLHIFKICTWEGTSSTLLDHALQKHPDFTVGANGNCFRFDIDISISNNVLKLLYVDSEMFLLHAECDTKELKLYYIMYYIGNCDKLIDFTYNVEQIGCEQIGCSLKLGTDVEVLPDSEFALLFDKDRAVSVDLTLVKQLVREPTVTTLVKISSASFKHEELDERMLNFFECPVCNHFMKPPIYQCLSGHSLCNRCKPKLNHCPTCRASFGNTRNYALETLSNGVRFPCLYRELGCQVVHPASEISKHESECSLRPYDCPFNVNHRCTWEGTHSKIATHLRLHHTDKTKFVSYNRTTAEFSYDGNFFNLYCMVAFDQVFRICYRRDMGNQNTYWAVQLVGPRGDGKKYKCEVGLIDSRNENRRLIRTDLCQDLSNYDNMFNQCIMIPSNIVSWFSNNGYVTYYLKINNIQT